MASVTKEYLEKQLHNFETGVLDNKYATPYTAGNGIDITNGVISTDLGTAAIKDSTDRVSPNNTALVESQSVYSAINTALSSIYTPRGDITCAELTSDLLIAANVGNIYETSDSGTTSALFLQGAGVPIPIGSNVGIINAGQGRILFNLMANAFDLTDYQKIDLTNAVEGQTTVEGALSALSTNKQDSLTFDNVPTENSNNPVKSSGIYSANQTLTSAFVNNVNENGCKNICPYELTNWSDRGITITDSADGNYKILNGTCTGNPLIISLLDEITPYPLDFTHFSNVTKVTPKQLGIDVTKKYVFSRQSFDNVRLSIYLLNGDTLSKEIILGTDPSVNSIEVDFSTYTFDKMFICAKIGINSVVNNYALKPMLCLKSDYDLDDKWTPPAKTNLQLTEDSVTWDNLSEVGAVNFLNHTATNLVQNGITFTVNADRSITANGTATAEEWVKIAQNEAVSESVRASGCPKGGTPSTYFMAFSQGGNSYRDYGDGVIVPSGTIDSVYIVIKPNATVDIVFKPMISPVSYNGPYVPYAKTNRELTEELVLTKGAIAPATGVTTSNLLAEKYGKVVIINGFITIADFPGGLFTLGTIEGDFCPKTPVRANVGIAEHAYDIPTHFAYLIIETSGNIKLQTARTGASAVYFSLSYTTN